MKSNRKPMRHRLSVEPLEVRRVLTAWHNADWACDVDQSGSVGPVDALLVVNELALRAHSDPATGALPANRNASDPLLDVRNNANVGPLDALQVIGDLNNVFTIAENATGGARAGRIVPSGGRNEDLRFELKKSEAIPESIQEVLVLKPDDHYQGATDAPVVLIEYIDLACPVCATYHPLVKQALQDFDGEVALVTRHFPLTVHPKAKIAAIAAEAAGRQGKFHEMADLLIERRLATNWHQMSDPTPVFRSLAGELGLQVEQFTQDMADPELEARVQRDNSEAIQRLGLGGTPSFVINDQLAQNPDANQPAFNQLLQAAVDRVDFVFKVDRFTGDIRVRNEGLLNRKATANYSFDVMINGVVEAVQVNVIAPNVT